MSLLWWVLISFLVATVGGVLGIHERRVGCVQSGPSTLRHFCADHRRDRPASRDRFWRGCLSQREVRATFCRGRSASLRFGVTMLFIARALTTRDARNFQLDEHAGKEQQDVKPFRDKPRE
jgi:hypothetical protein